MLWVSDAQRRLLFVAFGNINLDVIDLHTVLSAMRGHQYNLKTNNNLRVFHANIRI
jgi:ribulose 1,5-bisphosphate carboxylase large subunit-like protein